MSQIEKNKQLDKDAVEKLKAAERSYKRLAEEIVPYTKPKKFHIVSSGKEWESTYESFNY